MEQLRFIAKSAWQEAGVIARCFYIGVVGIPAALGIVAGLTGWKELQGLLPWWDWLFVAFLLALGGLVLAIGRRAKALNEEVTPNIVLEFKRSYPWVAKDDFAYRVKPYPNEEGYHVERIAGASRVVRCRAESLGTRSAGSSHPIISSVKRKEGKKWVEVLIHPIDLFWDGSWSNNRFAFLQKGVPQYFYVAATDQENNEFILMGSPQTPRLRKHLREPGTYRVKIELRGDREFSKPLVLDLIWKDGSSPIDAWLVHGARQVPVS